MKPYIDIFFVALITIFIVDLSGFTQSWRQLLAGFLHVKTLKPLPPFDCGLCATWWTCIVYSIVCGSFSLPVLAFIALLSYMSIPIGNAMIFIKETTISILNRISDHVIK